MKITILVLLAVACMAYQYTAAYAEPLEDITATISSSDGRSATVVVSWSHHDGVASYKAGCVSCSPNMAEFTSANTAELRGVTPFPNSPDVMLYVIAYDDAGEIITAKQLIVSLDQS